MDNSVTFSRVADLVSVSTTSVGITNEWNVYIMKEIDHRESVVLYVH